MTTRHLNAGAGRIVWQDIVRIDQTIRKGQILEQENIVKCFERAKKNGGRLHFMGLVRASLTGNKRLQECFAQESATAKKATRN